jgi:hypothetical protein
LLTFAAECEVVTGLLLFAFPSLAVRLAKRHSVPGFLLETGRSTERSSDLIRS